MPRQLWIAERAREFGLDVVEVDGWQTHGRTDFNPGGVVVHHTADGAGEIPSLRVLRDGRSDLPGPLCNWGLARSGTVYVVAAGKANHAGAGGWRDLRGNSAVLGVEAENRGDAGDPWPTRQLDAYHALCAAAITGPGVGGDVMNVCGHKEWAPTRKVDPHTLNMDEFRARVARRLVTPPKDEGEEEDSMYGLLTPEHNSGARSLTIAIYAPGILYLATDHGDARVRVAIGWAEDWDVIKDNVIVPHGKRVEFKVPKGSSARMINLVHRDGPNVGVAYRVT